MGDVALMRREIEFALTDQVIPFWLERSIDTINGGYLTSFDADGRFDGTDVKYIVTQCRMVWGFSHLARYVRDEGTARKMRKAADQGVDFLIDRMWDPVHGGFYWEVARDGSVLEPSKLTYGESFAIYALAEYALCYKDQRALDCACETFDLLQKYAADTLRGGYYENIERDWSVSPSGDYAGDRKSLDIHMHLMEAFTTLYAASGQEIHKRKLIEVTELILRHMVDGKLGYGRNQFTLDFQPIPAINIKRTWNAEREVGEAIAAPTDTTSYGHNVELSWLMDLAYQTLGMDNPHLDVIRALLDHSLRHGYDREFGGVYRDGVADGDALVLDKEWWQNFESMVGYVNGYVRFRDARYWDAFAGCWAFNRDKFINQQVGESRQLLARDGSVLVGNLGNPWKGIYHTGRALGECLDRLDRLEK